MELNNLDLKYVISILDRLREEIVKSASANRNGLKQHDVETLRSQITFLISAKDHIQAQPEVLCPKSHPRGYVIDDAQEDEDIENEGLEQIYDLLGALRFDLVNGDSARDFSNLTGTDEKMFDEIMVKIQNHLENHLVPMGDINFPESSPKAPDVKKGRVRVNK